MMFNGDKKLISFFIATWCKGSTTDFDSVSIGSNPIVVTIFNNPVA